MEAKEVQLNQRESDIAQSCQSIKNIRSIIDEKQILTRKLADMENELKAGGGLRKEAESQRKRLNTETETRILPKREV